MYILIYHLSRVYLSDTHLRNSNKITSKLYSWLFLCTHLWELQPLNGTEMTRAVIFAVNTDSSVYLRVCGVDKTGDGWLFRQGFASRGVVCHPLLLWLFHMVAQLPTDLMPAASPCCEGHQFYQRIVLIKMDFSWNSVIVWFMYYCFYLMCQISYLSIILNFADKKPILVGNYLEVL